MNELTSSVPTDITVELIYHLTLQSVIPVRNLSGRNVLTLGNLMDGKRLRLTRLEVPYGYGRDPRRSAFRPFVETLAGIMDNQSIAGVTEKIG
jgi:hypothetical protein